MRELPSVKYVRVNRAPFLVRSFIDPEYVFTFEKAGVCEYRMDNRLYTLRPGMVSLMPPYLLHVVKIVKPNVAKYVVHFELSTPCKRLAKLPLALAVPKTVQRVVQHLLREMQREWAAREPGYREVVAGMMTTILGLYIRHSACVSDSVEVPAKAWQQVQSAVGYIRENYRAALTLQQISESAGLSPTYFSRLFKEFSGLSPHRYLNHCRIAEAKRLILRGQCNCTEAARETGFETVHAFSRVFKKLTGLSPTHWLRNAGTFERAERNRPTDHTDLHRFQTPPICVNLCGSVGTIQSDRPAFTHCAGRPAGRSRRRRRARTH